MLFQILDGTAESAPRIAKPEKCEYRHDHEEDFESDRHRRGKMNFEIGTCKIE